MNKELITSSNHSASWKGYTIDEIRNQKAIILKRLEIQKNNMHHHVQSAGVNGYSTAKSFTGIVMKRFFGNISFINYIFIGFKVAKAVTKFIKTHKRKKFF